MKKGKSRKGFTALLFLTGAFFIIYVAIHILLNLTQQGTRSLSAAWATTDLHQFIIDISGPITISICSSLLILSFGSFLLNGLERLSVAKPMAFFDAFLLFVISQILVQITGHLEIAVNNANLTPSESFSILDIFSSLSYPILFMSLYALESYEERVYSKVTERFPNTDWGHSKGGSKISIWTMASILALFMLKFLITLPQLYQFKYIATWVSFGIELYIIILVMRSERRHSSVEVTA